MVRQGSPDVFVSYSRSDEDCARPLIEDLQRAGFTVWWDGMLEAGTVYTSTTEQALESARAVLVLWSARSVNSNWVRDEAQSGRDRACLVPVSVDGSLPPLGFRQFQCVDLSGWDGAADAPQIVNVRNAISRLIDPAAAPAAPVALSRAAQSPATPAGPGLWRSSGVRFGFAALVLAALAALAYFVPAFIGKSGNSPQLLAIMPFENISEDGDQAYFATGLAEEMRQTLSQRSDLQIVAQASSDQASEDGGDARAIARRLGVRYLLSGSVQRAGDKVRVTVQLIDGEKGVDVWTQGYDRELSDIFAVQSDIAGHVVEELQATLEGGEDGGVGRIGGTDNPAAYDAYLRGVAIYDLSTGEESDRAALAQFEAAIEADPRYGAAWATLARVQTTIANSYPSDIPLQRQYDTAIASAEKAIAVAPDLAVAHAALGYVLLNGRLDVAAARAPYETAYRLAPRNADILSAYGSYMGYAGKFAEARDAYERAIALDPLNATTLRQWSQVLFAEGKLDEAQAAIEQGLALNPEMRVAKRILADIAYQRGEYRKALALYDEENSALSRLAGQAMTHAKLGNKGAAQAAMAELKSEFGDNGLYQQAQILAQWGENAEALATLEKAFAAGDSGMVLLRNDPKLALLRNDPRFVRLLQRIGFTQRL